MKRPAPELRLTLPEVVAALATYFAEQDDVAVAYLFGSTARGTRRKSSDVDVAVVFEPISPTASAQDAALERFSRRARFNSDLEDLLRVDVDVVDLAAATPSFSHQVLMEKITLKGQRSPARIQFEQGVRRSYFGLLPYIKRYEEAALARLRAGGVRDGAGASGQETVEAAKRLRERLTRAGGRQPE